MFMLNGAALFQIYIIIHWSGDNKVTANTVDKVSSRDFQLLTWESQSTKIKK